MFENPWYEITLSWDITNHIKKEDTMRIVRKIQAVTGILIALALTNVQATEFAPYGTAKVDMHKYPVTNVVFDVNYSDPNKLNILNVFLKKTSGALKGKTVVVTHGPELRVFAKENYEKYQGIVDKMAAHADNGIEFRMCNNAMRAAGFKPSDMHGFIRENMVKTAESQLKNGVITSSAFISEFTDLFEAKSNLNLHKTQLLMQQIQYQITKGTYGKN